MARQRIHNSRSGTGAGNAGASWISYSDIMAALLLVFVLILTVTLYENLKKIEATRLQLSLQQSQLDTQQEQLNQQQIILLSQQQELDAQTLQLAAQQVTMDSQSAMIIIMQGELDEQQSALDLKELELSASKEDLENLRIILADKESALNAQAIALQNANVLLAQQQAQLESQQSALYMQTQQLGDMVGVKSEIIQEVTSALSQRSVTAKVDPSSGDIVIDSRDLRFETNKAVLSAESKLFLDRFIPVYLEVLLRPEYRDYLGSIIIEGHTDKSGTYERNMELSQERALEVLLYIRSMYQNDSATLARLDQILVATGKGYSDPIYYTYLGQQFVDQDASRRVEFKFSLRDAEMIEEINKLLNGR